MRDLAVLLGIAWLLGSCGGGNGAAPGPLTGTPPDGAVCDGANLSATTGAVYAYVSPQGSLADGCGSSTANSCLTIRRGIEACSARGSGCAVLVRHGLYETQDTITLRAGISVYGGCRFDGEAERGYRTTILATPKPGTPALAATSIDTPTTVHGLVVITKDETAAGTASIAMAVASSKGLTLTRTLLSAGRGGDGAAGSATGAGGGAGQPGQGATIGGAGGLNCPSNRLGSAGDGGHGGIDSVFWQPDGSSGVCVVSDFSLTDGQDSGAVRGGSRGTKGGPGLWCPNRDHDYPATGGPGTAGSAGNCGRPALVSPLSAGSFDGIAWHASKGDDGQAGAVGSGGGGGGSGGACCATLGQLCVDHHGLPGGGGGGGGCGGAASGGGQQGGASLPLVLADATSRIDPGVNAIVPGPGGRGGDAGPATSGGSGGGGGAGQTAPQSVFWGHYCGAVGADGGGGGWGGAGSAGAGGHGGPSIGMALVGTSPAPLSTDGIYAPLPGARGRGGRGGAAAPVSGACGGPDGQWAVAGLGAAFFDFNRAPQNFLAPGQQLARGQSRTSVNGRVQLVLQGDGNLCLYESGAYRWCSLQAGYGTADTVTMETDGYLRLDSNNGGGQVFLGAAPPGTYLTVQDDGHAVIGDGFTVDWTIP